MQGPNLPEDKNRLPPAFAVDQCPVCHAPVSPGKPAGHWDGDACAGFLYTAECQGCGASLVGTGKQGASLRANASNSTSS
jgi:hypothetical protein